MLNYPSDIQNTDFPDTARPSRPPPRPPSAETETPRRKWDATEVTPLNTKVCGVEEVYLSTADGSKRSASFDNRQHVAGHAALAYNDPKRFWFAPGPSPDGETVRIHVKFRNPAHIQTATIDLFRRGDGQPLWTQRIDWGEPGPRDEVVLDFDGLFDPARPEVLTEFPSPDGTRGCVNVGGSPYKLRVSLMAKEGVRADPSRAWTYFDVLAHSIELDWGDPTVLLPQRRPDVDPKHEARVLAYEKNIYEELRKAHPRPTADALHEVILTSDLFAKKAKGAMILEEARDLTDFEEYRKLWGHGPRIALVATLKIRRSDGTAAANLPHAATGARILWDWQDNAPRRWQDFLGPRATLRTREFVEQTFLDHNPLMSPPGSCNCPHQYGGKYGDESDEAQIFPPQPGTDGFRFQVERCKARGWASISHFGRDGDLGKTAVVFQPSRMAGDRYRVTAALYFDPRLDAEGDLQVPDELRAGAGTFEVFRRVHMRYLVRGEAKLGVDTQQCTDTLQALYRKALNIIVEVDKRTVDNNVYTQALRRAADRLERTPNVYTGHEKAPLLLRSAVDFHPPADSPGVCVHDKDQIRQRIQQMLLGGKLRAIKLTNYEAFLPGEEIVGTQSGARALLLTNSAGQPRPAPPYVILFDATAAELWDGEQVRGEASGARGMITYTARTHCTGRTYTVTPSSGSPYKDAIHVVLHNQRTVVVKYPREGISRTVSTEPSGTSLRELQEALRDVAGRLGDMNGPFHVELKAKDRGEGSRTQTRLDGLRTRLDRMFEQVVVDRQGIYDSFSRSGFRPNANLAWNVAFDDGMLRTALKKDLTIGFLLPLVIEEYISQLDPTLEGILFLHIAGRTNLRDLPGLKQGYQELKVSGAYYADTCEKNRAQGVVYLSTVDPAGPQVYADAQKSVVSIFAHEAAHALYMPHAPIFTSGSVVPSQVEERCHGSGDNCLMNYDIESEHFCGLCMFRMRGWNWKLLPNGASTEYEYKVELELGDVNDLFDTDITDDRGLMQRLQVLGLFNRPLDHPEADRCLSFMVTHAQELFPALRETDDDNIRDVLAGEIRNFLVEGGALPRPGEFRKIRIPGGYSPMYSQNYLSLKFRKDQEGTAVARPYESYMLGANRFEVENAYYRANPALGKVPLVARVKCRLKGSGTSWTTASPAAGVQVYFQLVKPDKLPDYTPPGDPNTEKHTVAGGSSFYRQVVAPPLAAAPDAYLKAKVYAPLNPANPQDGNAPARLGGKAYRSASSEQVQPVFFVRHEGAFVPRKFTPETGPHPYAAAVPADENGLARVFFEPSRIGGDRYKLRVFVGPPTQNIDPGKPGDAVVETGTMVRWRSVRVCRYIRVPPPTHPGELSADLRAIGQRPCNHEANKDSGRICYDCMLREGPLDDIDLKGTVTRELARAYCELILEPKAETPEPLSPHSADVVQKIKDLLEEFPQANCSNWPVSMNSPAVNPCRKAMQSVDRTGTRFRASVGADRLIETTVSIRPRGGGKDQAIVTDEDGTIRDTGKVPGGVNATIDYDSGDVEVTFNQPQPTASFEVVYRSRNFIDIDALLQFPPKSPYLFQMRFPGDYNAALGTDFEPMPVPDAARLTQPGYPAPKDHYGQVMTRAAGARYKNDREGLVTAIFMNALPRAIGRNDGFYPGIVLFHAAMLENYESTWDSGIQEGKGVGQGVYVFGGNMFRGGYSNPADDQKRARNGLNTLALHELSHALYLQHAPTHVPGGLNPGGAQPQLHDNADTCVMSYDACDGDYCGQCIALLRGINTRVAPFP